MEIYSYVFSLEFYRSSSSFIFVTHFELVCVNSVRFRSNFVFYVAVQLSQHQSSQGALVVKSEVKSLSPVRLCDPVDCSPPGSSVHGILQARILEWAAISFSRGSSRPRDRTQVSRIGGRSFMQETQKIQV